MKIVSFSVDDIDQIQEMANRRLGELEAWDLRFSQTECGPFEGSYAGAVLPSDRSLLLGDCAGTPDSKAQLREALICDPAIWASRHQYKRSLHVTGSASANYFSFFIPVGKAPALRHKGQSVGPEQVIAFPPGDNVEVVAASGIDCFCVMFEPDCANGILSALDRDHTPMPSGVLTPNKSGLRLLKSHLFRWFKPMNGSSHIRLTALKGLKLDIEESLIAALEIGDVSEVDPGPSHRHVIARLACDYMAVNLDRQIAISEICTVTGSTTRTLHYVFQNHFGTSPVRYHRYRRLKQARDDLRRFHLTETTVTRIALDWGFNHFGRFAADYRAQFGESPSQTLKSHG